MKEVEKIVLLLMVVSHWRIQIDHHPSLRVLALA